MTDYNQERDDVVYVSFKENETDAEPTVSLVNQWVESEESLDLLDDPEDFYGNNYTPGLGWSA